MERQTDSCLGDNVWILVVVVGGWKEERVTGKPRGVGSRNSFSESSRRGWPVAEHFPLSWEMTRKGALPLSSHLATLCSTVSDLLLRMTNLSEKQRWTWLVTPSIGEMWGKMASETCRWVCKQKQLFFFSIYLSAPSLSPVMWYLFNWGMRNLIPWPGIKPGAPVLREWSLSHWVTREVPEYLFIGKRYLWHCD